jgi:hypothetical protein
MSDDIVNWSGNPSQEDSIASNWKKQSESVENLEKCKNFKEVFQLVKQSVKETLKLERTGLMLFLADMPYMVGAFHQVGTNNIVMNRMLLDHVLDTSETTKEANSFIYSILTHEYLHALGYLDEREARDLTYRVSKETFGETHLATKMAASSPWQYIKPIPYESRDIQRPTSVVRDFEPPPFGLIS